MDLIEGNYKKDIIEERKYKFLQMSRLISFWLIISNFGVYFMPLFWKIMIISGLLGTAIIFMLLSLFVLILTFPRKINNKYIQPFFNTVCCCYCNCRLRDRSRKLEIN